MDKKKFLVVSDLDDTLFNTVSEALQLVYEKTGTLIDFQDITSYDIAAIAAPIIGLPLSKTRQFFQEHIWNNPETYRRSRPDYGVWYALKSLQKRNDIEIKFLTSRPQHLAELTRSMVDDVGFPDEEIIFGSMNEKASIISQLDAEGDYDKVFLLDDCSDIEMEVYQTGTLFLGMMKPWCNCGFEGRGLLGIVLDEILAGEIYQDCPVIDHY